MKLCKWPDPPLHCRNALKEEEEKEEGEGEGGGGGGGRSRRSLMATGDGTTDPSSAPFKVLQEQSDDSETGTSCFPTIPSGSLHSAASSSSSNSGFLDFRGASPNTHGCNRNGLCV